MKRKGGLLSALAGRRRARATDAAAVELQGVEHHRDGIGLSWAERAGQTGFALLRPRAGHPDGPLVACTCGTPRRCPHVKRLVEHAAEAEAEGRDLALRSSLWFRLLEPVAQEDTERVARVRVEHHPDGWMRVLGPAGTLLLRHRAGDDAVILRERLDQRLQATGRGALLRELRLLTATDTERALLVHGHRSQGQALEESVWYAIAYHGFRQQPEARFSVRVDQDRGELWLDAVGPAGPLLELAVPRVSARRLVRACLELLPDGGGLRLHPEPARGHVRISRAADGSVELVPLLRLPGEEELVERDALAHLVFDDLIYLPAPEAFARLGQPGPVARALRLVATRRLGRDQVPALLRSHEAALDSGDDGELLGLRLVRDFDRLEIRRAALERGWWWLSVRYRVGGGSVALADILRARGAGRRFLDTEAGWIDTHADAFDPRRGLGTDEEPAVRRGKVRLSGLALLRLQAEAGGRLQGGPEELRELLELRPRRELEPVEGLGSTLRPYQELGVKWLLSLHDHRLGGLLCDDMGLGKTHQVMALMLALRQQREARGPFLVVCPATVVHHWERLIGLYAPSLAPRVHHGTERRLGAELGAELLLTTYGVLRNDVALLAEVPWELVVFDEAQMLKNPESQVHQAAGALMARSHICLTGTPVENAVEDLKALFDLVLPRYLGGDAEFRRRFVEAADVPGSRERLRRLASPFTLRRLKATVLHELPDKIEDLRACTLSTEQAELYRQALQSRGAALASLLRDQRERIPYLHVFALLQLLKQICNHPALAGGDVEHAEAHASGKWDVFEEVLRESLGSGHKVVVYSQYLDMIRIIERLLARLEVPSVTLTGESRKRGEIVRRFQEDSDCRVLVASLMAGGVGIDLTAASVVIHYDRWWNAAREDQATDRVHRIGQQRGVQVIKLVTAGTLEEKIAALIDHKRALLDSVVQEDDPGLLKRFTREQLLDLLTPPG